MKMFAGLAVSTAALLASNLAAAQLAGAGARLSTSGEVKGDMQYVEPMSAKAAAETPPPPAAKPPPSPIAGDRYEEKAPKPKVPDHTTVVRRFAVGFLGMRDIKIGTDPLNPGTSSVNAPLVGVRYWVGQTVGVDAGMGFFLHTGTLTVPGQEDTFTPSYTGVIVHGGLPLALANSGHFSFQVTPEFNIALASSTIDSVDPDSVFNGSHWDVGVRLGAEVHFGFIDIPELSLQGGVGIRYSAATLGGEIDDEDFSTSTTTVETTVGTNPWDIFTSSIAALYYF